MSLSKRSSLSPPRPDVSTQDLKQRVITCLNKLADRDTLALATSELELIAKSLTYESFSPFLSCIYNTDASSKSPVRKQCVSLLGLLSHSHGDALSPFLAKMISTVVRRLRDSDTAVRSACVDATASMSSQITKPPFSAFLKPLMETLTLEQDLNSQIGSALCLAAAVEAAPDPEVLQLRKCLPKLGKLAKSEGFKAKAALLVLIGNIVDVGGASSRGVLDWWVPCVVEFLSSEDWAVRKAAAETLGRVAVTEMDLATEYKELCVSSLEARRFDKIKVVRETMNQSLELWKEIPSVSEEAFGPSPSKSSSTDNGSASECFPHLSESSHDLSIKGPLKKTVPTNRSPPSAVSLVTNAKRGILLKSNEKISSTPTTSKLDHNKPSDWKVEIAARNSLCSNVASEDDTKRSVGGDLELREDSKCGNPVLQTKRVLFSNARDEKVNKFSSLRSGSRVVPFQDDDNINSNVIVSSTTEEMFENHKDVEDLSLIRDQLLQIENQQSSLLDLLQRFIGSSQSGMNSLETRVCGLEKALDEISYDLAVSSGRVPNSDFAENTCCKLPGTEFLSSKFWRRTEGRFSGPRFSSTSMGPSSGVHQIPDKDATAELSIMLESQRFQSQSRDRLVGNSLEDVHGESKHRLGHYSIRARKKKIQDDGMVQGCNASSGTDVVSSVTSKIPANLSSSRSAA